MQDHLQRELKIINEDCGRIPNHVWIARHCIINLMLNGQPLDTLESSALELHAITKNNIFDVIFEEAKIYRRIFKFITKGEL